MTPLSLWEDSEYLDGYVRTLVSDDGVFYQLHFFDGSTPTTCKTVDTPTYHMLTSVDGCEYV